MMPTARARHRWDLAVALGAIAIALALLLAPGAGPPPPARAAAPQLRVCADPNNLPFSNRAKEGFENRIAALLAAELGRSLRYVWLPERRGYVRHTLGSGVCDMLLGVPEHLEAAVLLTRPYYRSTYVFLSRADDPRTVRSLDDPLLRQLKVGVQMIGDDYQNTPLAHALARRHIDRNVVGFPIYGDYAKPNPPSKIVEAVASGDIDLAIVWGPFAGYFAPKQAVELRILPVEPAADGPSLLFTFAMALGVAPRDTTLRDRLDAILARRHGDIERLLDRYGVPQAGDTAGMAAMSSRAKRVID